MSVQAYQKVGEAYFETNLNTSHVSVQANISDTEYEGTQFKYITCVGSSYGFVQKNHQHLI